MNGAFIGRVVSLSVLVIANACMGVMNSPNGSVSTTATFNLSTFSDYDSPYAEWSVDSTDNNFSYFECLVEKIHIATKEVLESGIWTVCSSPWDFRNAAGIDVSEGFIGQVTVRAVSISGDAGNQITKYFRRANFGSGFDNVVNKVAILHGQDAFLAGGLFTSMMNGELSSPMKYIAGLNSDGSPDLSAKKFLSGFSWNVYAVAVQSNGKLLVGGAFFGYDNSTLANLISLNTDGSIDTSFSGLTSAIDGTVYAIAVQSDGKILIGGSFTSYNGGAAPDNLLRLNTDGSMDSTFTGLTTGFDGDVQAITLQSDGKILVGGNFTTYNGGAAPDRLIRLNTDGTVSPIAGLTTGFNATVFSVAVQSDGKILVGGNFTTYNGGAAPDRLIRLTTTGAIDATFTGITTGFDDEVNEIVLQDDGMILLGGRFTTFNGGACPDLLVRLTATGSIDPSFSGLTSGFSETAVLNQIVNSIYLQSDGKIVVGGEFTALNGSTNIPTRLLRLDANGNLDTSFMHFESSPAGSYTLQSAAGTSKIGFNGAVHSIVKLANDKYIVGGEFTKINSSESSVPPYFAAVNGSGKNSSALSALSTGFDGGVSAMAVQSDGKILLGGSFTTYNGVDVPDYFIRLNADGSVDSTFSGLTSGFDNTVLDIVVQSDGKILVGGAFTTYNGAAAPDKLIRLTSTGAIDGTFVGLTSGFDQTVYAITVQSDGKILVGGSFTTYNGGAAPDRLIRLTSTGAIDGTFTGLTTGFDQAVQALAMDDSGKVLVGGSFTTYNGGASPDKFVRLNSDGSLDATAGITSGPNSDVVVIKVLSNSKIMIGGFFNQYNGTDVPDGLIRLNSDCSHDTSFAPGQSGFPSSAIRTLDIFESGKILVGGSFTSYNCKASAPDNVIILNTDGSVEEAFLGSKR